MKVDRKDMEPSFKPFELSFIVETKEEAQALYAIFNLTDNARLIGAGKSEKIKRVMGDYYVGGGSVIANEITYSEFYQSKPGRN